MSSIQTFNTAFPFDVKIQNLYQGELLSVLYILDKNKTESDLTNILVKILPNNNDQFQFSGFDFPLFQGQAVPVSSIPALSPSNATFSPSAGSNNISLAFRPGVLSETVIPNFSDIFQNAVTAAISNNPCCVQGPFVRPTDGAFVWYCAFQNIVDIPNGLSFTLNGVSASSGVGSRSTQIEVGINSLIVNGNTSSLLGYRRDVHIDIINHQGTTFAPLYFGVLGENTLKNNASNDLKVYFETIGRVPIQFGKDTKFSFKFSYNTSSSNLMHFGAESEISTVNWDLNVGVNGVQPLNSLNNYNGTPNANFADQYSTQEAGPTDDNNGFVELSQIFLNTIENENQEWDTLNGQVTAFTKQKQLSFNFYTANSNGPVPLVNTIVANFQNAIDYSKQPIPTNFYPELQVAAQPYLSQILSAQQILQIPPQMVAAHVASNAFVPQFNSQCAIVINQPFSTQSWDSNCDYYNLNYEGQWTQILDGSGHYSSRWPMTIITQGQSDPSDGFYTNGYSTNHPIRWNNNQFVNFLKVNFQFLITQLATCYPGQDIFYGTQSYVMPGQALYDYLLAAFNTFTNCLTNNYLATILGDTTVEFTKQQWQSAYQSTNAALTTSQQAALTTDNGTVYSSFTSADPFSDSDFFNYVKNNLVTLLSGQLIQSRFYIPSASLYDYLYSTYQNNVYQSLLNATPQKIKFYINPVTCVFNFIGLKLSGSDGVVILNVSAKNIPSYWDTDFQIPIIKATTAGVPIGTIVSYYNQANAVVAAPPGWLLCNGDAIPAEYTQLINLVGSNTPVIASSPNYGWIIKC